MTQLLRTTASDVIKHLVDRGIIGGCGLHFAPEQLRIDSDDGCTSPHQHKDMDEVDGVALGRALHVRVAV